MTKAKAASFGAATVLGLSLEVFSEISGISSTVSPHGGATHKLPALQVVVDLDLVCLTGFDRL